MSHSITYVLSYFKQLGEVLLLMGIRIKNPNMFLWKTSLLEEAEWKEKKLHKSGSLYCLEWTILMDYLWGR